MGPAASDPQKASVHEKLLSVFNKAGYEVIYPEVHTLTLPHI
jgi:D-lactate dehydrogenase